MDGNLGPTGLQGSPGDDGPTGDIGPRGFTGPSGRDGTPGTDGSTGVYICRHGSQSIIFVHTFMHILFYIIKYYSVYKIL